VEALPPPFGPGVPQFAAQVSNGDRGDSGPPVLAREAGEIH
jgi:hypothetical protein